jgi:3-oxo-5alpha-steroid 4-dehydrogenase
MTPDTDVKPVAAASITSWDDEAGVVIAGYGVAGAAAAVEAARSGADVLVLASIRGRAGDVIGV